MKLKSIHFIFLFIEIAKKILKNSNQSTIWLKNSDKKFKDPNNKKH